MKSKAALFLLPVCTLLAAWLLLNGWPSDSSLRRIQKEQAIRIGFAIEEPFAFLDANGRPTGESIEVAQAVVRRLGIPRIRWCLTEFGSLMADLESGRFDVIASGLFITQTRSEIVAFSEPTIHVNQALLVNRGNPLRLHSYEGAVRQAGIKIAVVRGAIEETLFRQLGMPEARLAIVPDALTGRVAMETGLAAGMALSSPTIRLMGRADKLGHTEPAEPFSQTSAPGIPHFGYCAFAFRHSDRTLLEAWNRVLADYIGSEEHKRTIATFGFGAADLPGFVKTRDILSAPTTPQATPPHDTATRGREPNAPKIQP